MLSDAAQVWNILYWTRVVVSPLRLSKKPGDNKTKKSKQVSQKYTASRLHEKGVLIAIEDLQPNQWVSAFCHAKPGQKGQKYWDVWSYRNMAAFNIIAVISFWAVQTSSRNVVFY